MMEMRAVMNPRNDQVLTLFDLDLWPWELFYYFGCMFPT